MVTLTVGIMFLLFTCMQFWAWGILRRWSACAPTACEVIRDCGKFEKGWSMEIYVGWLVTVKIIAGPQAM
jgi:hypothetical protein